MSVWYISKRPRVHVEKFRERKRGEKKKKKKKKKKKEDSQRGKENGRKTMP
jgi:hypothetical protein